MGMKKLTKAQKAECPQYVLRIDFLSIGTGKGYEYVILKENTMGLAIKTAENIIDKFGRDNVYLADIFEKTTKENEYGSVIYDHTIRTRIPFNANLSYEWHLCDDNHSENPVCSMRWMWSNDEHTDGYLDDL